MNRIIGQLIEGFGVKLLALGITVWVGSYAVIAVVDAFQRVQDAFHIGGQ